MSLLQVTEIYKREGKDFALQGITFAQQGLQKIAIAGETGSGKSTLLKIIAGIMSPDTGQVLFENKRLKRIPEEKLIPGHPGIAYLSQQFELPHFLTVEQVLIYANPLPDEEAETDEQAKKLYEICRITHLLKRRTDQLSGGERQRIAVARLLISAPRLLLLDEPYSNLDMIHTNILKSVVQDIVEKLQVTCILVSHDPLDTISWADEIIILKNGQIIQQGPPKTIYTQPVNEYVAGLFGKYNLISTAIARHLFGMPLTKVANKNMLVRPEGFKIAASEHGALRGKVNNVFFYGSYHMLEVLLAGNYMITVRTDNCAHIKGDTIYISLPVGDIWYI